MRLFVPIALLALASCVRPPAQPAPVAFSPPHTAPATLPDLAPRYPSWDEVRRPPVPPAADAPPPLSAAGKPLMGGASFIDKNIRHNGRTVRLQAVLFDSRSYSLRVIDQPEDWSGGGKIAACMRRVNATAGVNGGFFTPQFAPMGLMIAAGRQTGAWQQNKLLSGAVIVQQQPQLLWNAEVHHASHAHELLQAGPRLVDAGHAVPNLERRKHVPRTFIATDGEQRWLIGLVHDISLGDLAEVLATPGAFPGGFRIHRALNLDGGHSSALYYRTADGQEHSDPGWSTVRNYLGIVPR